MRLSGQLGKSDPLRALSVPSLDRLLSACRRVHKRWPDVMPTPQGDRESIVQEMLRRLRQDDWEAATLASVTRAGRVAFDPEFRERRDLRQLRKFYVEEAKASTRQAFLGALMSIYLGSYEPGSRHTKDLAEALDQSRDRLGQRWSGLLRSVHYVLDARNASRWLGAEMCEMSDPWAGLVKRGFSDPHASGLLHHAHLAYVERMGSELRTEAGVRQMLGWLAPAGREARVSGAKEAIEALLRHWKSREPTGGIRDLLIEGLVASYGDPRVRRGGVWPQVHSDCRNVLVRWLTGANIQFFLDVVSQVETSHMWQPRREFWWDLYEQGRIEAAWVAFSPDAVRAVEGDVAIQPVAPIERPKARPSWRRRPAVRAVRQLAQQPQSPVVSPVKTAMPPLVAGVGKKPSHLAYGEQMAGGSRRHTSLLILKIGNCIVVEGSHSYAVHVFRNRNRRAPRLFERQYDCEQIRLASDQAVRHLGRWQERVLELIAYWS